MNPKRRERLEVIYDLLVTIREHYNGIKPTPLLRFSNLSPNSFSDYYQELLTKEFIKEVMEKNGGKYITLTDKGFKYIEKYKYILDLLNEFEL
jgi:predicted transcriptional regulator